MRNQVKLRGILSKVLILSALVVALLTLPSVSPIQAQSDDYSDEKSQATLIGADGKHKIGTINSDIDRLDVDYFKFETRRGVRYTFELAFVDKGENTLKDAQLKVINSDQRGSTVSEQQVESRTESSKSVKWVARTADIYFLTVSTAYAPGTTTPYLGQYRLTVREETELEDLHSDARDQSERVTFGSQYQGAISPWSNQPSFSGTVQGGDDYDFFNFYAIRGAKYAFTATLRGMDGLKIEVTDSGGVNTLATNRGLGNSLEWVAQNAGSYYITLTGSPLVPQPVGAYILQVDEDGTLRDRYPDSQGSANPINLGNFISGAISPRDDKDFFSFHTERGVEYTIDIDMVDGAAVYIEVRDGSNEIKATNRGIGSSLAWTAETQGDTYIGISASLQLEDPVVNYNFRITGDNTMQDRHAGTKGSATRINLEIGIAASISPPGDHDYFSFDAKRGVSYTIKASLRSISGLKVQIAGSDEDIETSIDNVADDIEWTAPEDGTYYLIISGLSRRDKPVGTYNIRIDGDNSLEDRHGDGQAGATTVGYGNLVSGAISPDEDQDYFSFDAKRGVEYTFKLAYDGLEAVSLTVEGVGDHSGVLASNFGQVSEVVWIAPDDGEYFLAVSKSPMVIDGTGSYTLEISADTSLEDRHKGDYLSATKIGLGSAISAAISPADDQDYFLFAAEKGTTYTLDVELGTAESVIMTISHQVSGFTQTNFGSGEPLQWTAPAKGDYIVLVTGAVQIEDSVGTYRVTMRRAELPEVSVAQPLPVDSSEKAVPTPDPKAETETRVEPDPSAVPSGAALRVGSRTAGPGATVLIPVRLEKGEQVRSLGFNVNYDPTVARAVRVYRGARMSPATFSFNAAVPGLIRIGAAARAGVSGDGSAAVIEFSTVGDRGSYSDVTISGMVVSDAGGELRSIEVHHGLLTVESAGSGDGNGDGRVTAVDALIAMRMFVGLVSEDLVMDMNGDGRVTSVDSMQILNLARRG